MAKTPATASNALPQVQDDSFEEFAGAGMENVGAGDLLVPRLGILQPLSPQLKKNKSEYIEGAEAGLIADIGTGEIFPGGVWFLPVYYRKEYLEWHPRESGKGLAAIHSNPAVLDGCTRDESNGRMMMPNGETYIAETAQFFGLNLSAGRRWSFIPMTSTQLKKARRWNTLATGEKLRRADGSEFTAPMFYRSYNLGTADEENNKGEWVGWTINRGPALPEITKDDHGMDWRQIKQEALAFHRSLAEGAVRGDVAGLDGGDAEGAM